MQTGLDILLHDETLLRRLRSLRLGVLSHAASIDSKGEHIILALRAKNIKIHRLFSPEHGLWGVAQDMESVKSGFDAIAAQDVVSLYRDDLQSLQPENHSLDDLDAVVIDIQDVGARYYTFVYTALFLTQAALKRGLEVYLLDRPNPINANDTEGNIVQNDFRSFVGMRPIATRHGMTSCELVRMWCHTEKIPHLENLHCIWMKDYDRRRYYDELPLLWTMPSPNMPRVETAVLYPGLCLIEGTNLSEGRGTTRPFEYVGAPWLNPIATCNALKCLELPGILFRPVEFRPMFQKHAGKICGGIELFVTDRTQFKPLLTGIALLCVIRALHEEFDWRRDVYEFEGDKFAIDLLFGTDAIRKAIESQKTPYTIAHSLIPECENFRQLRQNWLHYAS